MAKRGKNEERRKATFTLVQTLVKRSTDTVRKGPVGSGDVAQAIRLLYMKRRLSREELDRATTI